MYFIPTILLFYLCMEQNISIMFTETTGAVYKQKFGSLIIGKEFLRILFKIMIGQAFLKYRLCKIHQMMDGLRIIDIKIQLCKNIVSKMTERLVRFLYSNRKIKNCLVLINNVVLQEFHGIFYAV